MHNKSCEICWREYAETVITVNMLYRYCAFHVKELKKELDALGIEYF